jgi:hypothetical protein
MGFFSDVDIEVMEMVRDGADRDEVALRFPYLRESELDVYFGEDGEPREPDHAETDEDEDVITYDDLIDYQAVAVDREDRWAVY